MQRGRRGVRGDVRDRKEGKDQLSRVTVAGSVLKDVSCQGPILVSISVFKVM